MRILLFILLLFFGWQTITTAQVDSTPVDSVVIDSTVLVQVSIPEPEETDQQTERKASSFQVIPWEFHSPIGADITATDSTLRWQIWPDWSYKLNQEPGIISYRMGTSYRSNAVQRFAHEPRHQQLYWEGISLNDPVSGAIDWSIIPQNKIGSFYGQDLGTVYRSTYYHRQYYLTEPLSRLIYNESSFNSRDLEFEVSHNLSKQTNIEVSYMNRRAGGEYANSEVTGNYIFAKVSHHFDPGRYLKLNYINNSGTVGRPFGYAISDLRLFNFDRYTAVANQGNAESSDGTSLLALNFYQRSDKPDQGPDDFHSSLYYRGNEREMTYNADSTHYKTQSLGINARKWTDYGPISLEGGASYEYFLNQQTEYHSLTAPNWGLLQTDGKFSLDVGSFAELRGEGSYNIRSDGYQSYRLETDGDITLGNLTLSPGASMGTILPTPQQLYWDSANIEGVPDLNNEQIQEVRGTVGYQFSPGIELGLRAQHKDITDGIMVEDSSLTNITPYASQSATASLKWHATNFEFDGSATVHQYTSSISAPNAVVPMNNEQRVWLKGSLYWKGYLLDRATYVKAGLSGMMAPFRYQADHYNPEVDTWQPLSNDQLLPVYNRLDVNLSARVRSIMFVIRYENVLDDVNQLGYFETAGYPMSQRRLVVGIRALFRN